ncbi:HAD hydrolase-like protein [Planococcus ruber]|nr:HAD family hydrolase [Planococcus ruber]MCJ1909190.1 HAD hydrolase-like protein [Planococcus ruber]
MKHACIFDMDGTLFQTDRILEAALEDAFSHLRSKGLWDAATPIGQYRAIMGVPLPKVWETLLPEHTQMVREETNAYFHARLIWNIQNGKGALYPNAEKLFGYLKDGGNPIFIASNGQTEYLKAIVDFYGLDQWVTETFSIEQIPTLDKRDLVKSIVEKYSLLEGTVIGDRLSDIQAAKANGLTAIGCRFDFAQESELREADFIIEDLQEIKGLLPAIGRNHAMNIKV